MQANAPGKNDLLQIAPFPDQVLDRISMADADDVLFDNGAIVQLFGDVVAGRPDQLDASTMCLVIGL